MNKKQPEITERTKQNLKDAFWSLYKENKIERITVKDIASKAGYNRTTFYAYFTDVYDVLEQIESDVMPGIEHLPPISNTISSKNDFISNIINIYETNGDYYSVLLSENGDPSFTVKMKNMFKKLMKESMNDNNSTISEVELDYILEFFTGATISVIKHWYDSDKNISPEQLMPLIYQLMNNQFVENFYSMRIEQD